MSFFYNPNNTIDKMQSNGTGNDNIKKFYYNNGVLDRAEYQDLNSTLSGSVEKYAYNNGQLIERQDFYDNTILDERFVYTFSNNNIANIKYFGTNEAQFSEQYIFNYDSYGNITSRTTDYVDNTFISDRILTLTYDNQKSPFLNFEPKVVLIDDFLSFTNNLIKEVLTETPSNNTIYEIDYSYSYDNDGYPLTMASGNTTIIYEYY